MDSPKKHRIYTMPFARVYPMYIAKAKKKRRTKKEVDEIICWLTGYTQKKLDALLAKQTDIETFIAQAPMRNPARTLIKGVVCGVRVEDIKEPTMREIRYLDKLIDELAKGWPMEKILRTPVDWRAETLSRIRTLIAQAAPNAVEEVKYKTRSNPAGVPVWYDNGMICTGETYKTHLRLTFSKGRLLKDPKRVLNRHTALVIEEGDKLNATAFKALIREAVALNHAKKSGKKTS